LAVLIDILLKNNLLAHLNCVVALLHEVRTS